MERRARREHLAAEELTRARAALEAFAAAGVRPLAELAGLLAKTLAAGGRIFAAGNGGSAADAQHFAAELVGRYGPGTRRALPAVALTTDTSILTAVANDFGFDRVFVRQLEALGRPGDFLLALSTSGRSPSVLAALQAARAGKLGTALLTGQDAPDGAAADFVLRVPARETPRIQELHALALHILCALIEEELGEAGA